jgi:hypothetical protein
MREMMTGFDIGKSELPNAIPHDWGVMCGSV